MGKSQTVFSDSFHKISSIPAVGDENIIIIYDGHSASGDDSVIKLDVLQSPPSTFRVCYVEECCIKCF